MMSLKAVTGSLAPAAPAGDLGLFRSAEEASAGVAAFNAKKEAAGIKSWNIVAQNVTDPIIKAGLGQIVDFNDFIPVRMAGKCSDAVLEQTLNIYNEMKADGAKAFEIKAALGPIFLEHAKEIEAARTDQVPRIRRFNFAVEDLHFLYQGPYKKLSGDSWIEGSRAEAVLGVYNGVRKSAPTWMLNGHAMDLPLMEDHDQLIGNVLLKNEVWAHSGEHVLAWCHPAWTTEFVLEAETVSGEKCSVGVNYPINSMPSPAYLGMSEETAAKISAASSAGEKHEIAKAELAGYDYMLTVANDVQTKVGDSRPNPTKNFVCRLMGLVNGEGSPSQQVARYQADQEIIDKFASFQNEVALYPASNCTFNDALSKTNRHAAKYNTQTILGKSNTAKLVHSGGFAVIAMALL